MNPVSLQPADAAVVPFINNLTHANQPIWAMVMIKLATEYTEAVFELAAQHNTPFHPYAFPPRMHRKVLSDRNMPWDAAWDPAPAVAHVPAVPAFAGDAAANPPIPAVPAAAAIPAQPARPDGPILATTFPGLESIVPEDGSEPTKWAQTVYADKLAKHKALHAINAELKRKLLASTPVDYQREVKARVAAPPILSFGMMTVRELYAEMVTRFVPDNADAAATLEAAFGAAFSEDQLASCPAFIAALNDKEAILDAFPSRFTKTFQQLAPTLYGLLESFPLGKEIVRLHGDRIEHLNDQSFGTLSAEVNRYWESKGTQLHHDAASAAVACASHARANATGPAGKVYMVDGIVDTAEAHAAAAAAAAQGAGKGSAGKKNLYCFGCGKKHAGGGRDCPLLATFIAANGDVYEKVKYFVRPGKGKITVDKIEITVTSGFLLDDGARTQLSKSAKQAIAIRSKQANTDTKSKDTGKRSGKQSKHKGHAAAVTATDSDDSDSAESSDA